MNRNRVKFIFIFIFILIYRLKREESLSYNNYKRKIVGVWKKKRILTKTDEINDFIKKYKKKGIRLIDKKCEKMISLIYSVNV